MLQKICDYVEGKTGERASRELLVFLHSAKFTSTHASIVGRKNLASYIHTMPSGHICDHVVEWKNSRRCFQQGWESLNLLIRSFFFRRVSQGGGKARYILLSITRLLLILRLFQRRLLWMPRIGDVILDECEKSY